MYCNVPSRTWKPGKPGVLNFSCSGPEIAWNVPQNMQKRAQNCFFLAENMDKTWNVKIYNISILY